MPQTETKITGVRWRDYLRVVQAKRRGADDTHLIDWHAVGHRSDGVSGRILISG